MNIKIIDIVSSLDGETQKAAVLRSEKKMRPLIIALHTWSSNYEQEIRDDFFSSAKKRDWHCIFPDFRGPNDNQKACCSEYAMRDIADSLEWAENNLDIDHRRIFLCGVSGGGMMALQCAGNFPTLWTAVSAWVPISDLVRWHSETNERGYNLYKRNIEQSCGGVPGSSPFIDNEYKKRSPITSLWRAHIIPLDINAGIHDGHGGKFKGEGSVPVGHSIRAFNEIVKASGRKKSMISEENISYIEKEETIPEDLKFQYPCDAKYDREIHLRIESGLTRLTLFEGGHEILYDEAFRWFEIFCK